MIHFLLHEYVESFHLLRSPLISFLSSFLSYVFHLFGSNYSKIFYIICKHCEGCWCLNIFPCIFILFEEKGQCLVFLILCTVNLMKSFTKYRNTLLGSVGFLCLVSIHMQRLKNFFLSDLYSFDLLLLSNFSNLSFLFSIL